MYEHGLCRQPWLVMYLDVRKQDGDTCTSTWSHLQELFGDAGLWLQPERTCAAAERLTAYVHFAIFMIFSKWNRINQTCELELNCVSSCHLPKWRFRHDGEMKTLLMDIWFIIYGIWSGWWGAEHRHPTASRSCVWFPPGGLSVWILHGLPVTDMVWHAGNVNSCF